MLIQPHEPSIRALHALLLSALLALTACSSNDDSGDMGTDADGASTASSADAGAVDAGETDTGETDSGGSDAGMTDAGASDSASADAGSTTTYAYAATASFPTGQIERIAVDNGYIVDGTYPATQSDIRAKTDGVTIYQLGRFQIDSLTKFDTIDTSAVEYQYSLNGTETSSNPHDVVFIDENKAYVVRYGSPIIWIINPSATTEEEFKIGEIDISAYDPDPSDEDLSPNAESAVAIDGKLYVLMQRLSGFSPVETSYVAVFDIATDTEINTQMSSEGLNGIPLNSLNATNIRFNETTGEIYVTGRGNIFVDLNMLPGDPYSGGLFAIDKDTYTVSQLLDDGDANSNEGRGFIQRTLVVSDTKGYVSLYTGFDPDTFASFTSVRTFNPSTGEYGEAVQALVGEEVADLTQGSDGNVWVGVNGDTPGYRLLNSTDDSLQEPFVATSLNPLNVVFIDVPMTEDGQ